MLTRPFWILEDETSSQAEVDALAARAGLTIPDELAEFLRRFAGADVDVDNSFSDPDDRWDCVFYVKGFQDDRRLNLDQFLEGRELDHLFPLLGTERGNTIWYDLTSGEIRYGKPGYPVLANSLATMLEMVDPD